MDVHFSYRGLHFVWNSMKAIENRTKHGVDFEKACQVFFDDLCAYENASVYGEERAAVVGLDEAGRLLFVVHIALEAEQHIRIISARHVNARERKHYEDG